MPPLTCRLLLVSVGTKGLLCPGTEVLGLFQLSHAPKVSVEKLGPQKIRAKFWHRSGIWLCCFSGYLALRSNSCARSERSLGMWLDHAERRKRQYRVWIGCPATCYPVGMWCFVTFTVFVRFFFWYIEQLSEVYYFCSVLSTVLEAGTPDALGRNFPVLNVLSLWRSLLHSLFGVILFSQASSLPSGSRPFQQKYIYIKKGFAVSFILVLNLGLYISELWNHCDEPNAEKLKPGYDELPCGCEDNSETSQNCPWGSSFAPQWPAEVKCTFLLSFGIYYSTGMAFPFFPLPFFFFYFMGGEGDGAGGWRPRS